MDTSDRAVSAEMKPDSDHIQSIKRDIRFLKMGLVIVVALVLGLYIT